MNSLGYAGTNLEGKCANCNHYTPNIKTYKNLGKVEMCHGTCGINTYVQRTATCTKFSKKEMSIDDLPFSEMP